ncbi:MAG: primosomal protein N' [Chitinophagales bacterium]|jgi:primosomal protein N' (replication factor Y)|nr:primosomal protein N' [Chitinophagales bacterium]
MYAIIGIPLAIAKEYTYLIPDDIKNDIQVGSRVLVSFGHQKLYSGVVLALVDKYEGSYKVKPISSLIDAKPILTSVQISLIRWTAQYYMTTVGQVLDIVLPAYFKISSEKKFSINEEMSLVLFEEISQKFPNIAEIMDLINTKESIKLKEIQDLVGKKEGYKLLSDLVKNGILLSQELYEEKYKPKLTGVIAWKNPIEIHQINDIVTSLEKSPKQKQLFIALLTMLAKKEFVEKAILNQEYSHSIIQGLIDKDLIEIRQEDLSELDLSDLPNSQSSYKENLSIAQEILSLLSKNQNVYFQHLDEAWLIELYGEILWILQKQNKKVVLILPELTLYSRKAKFLIEKFKKSIVVYANHLSQRRKADSFQKILSGDFSIVLATKSIAFFNLSQVDLVILDDEHDSKYKLGVAPYIQYRDVLLRAQKEYNFQLLFSSATPSLELYHRIVSGKFTHFQKHSSHIFDVNDRISWREVPFEKIMKNDFYDKKMLTEIQKTLNENSLVFIYQNRRGYSPYVQCKVCGTFKSCKNCDVKLNYHVTDNLLHCHYCSATYEYTRHCQTCQSTHIELNGVGTQKISEEFSILFDDYKILRVDLDVMKSKISYDEVMMRLKEKTHQIVIGTQLALKQIDFKDFRLFVVLDINNFFVFHDYRSDELGFQAVYHILLKINEFSIPTIFQYSRAHDAFDFLKQMNIAAFYEEELLKRKTYLYPPFVKLIKIELKHRYENIVDEMSRRIVEKLSTSIQCQILGPIIPYVSRIKNQFIREILIKLEINAHLQENKEKIFIFIEEQKALLNNRNLIVNFIIDY